MKTEFFRLKMDFKKKNLSDKAQTDWVKGGKKRFDRIRNKFQNAKNNNLQARPSGKFINFIESNKLIQDTAYSKIKLPMRKH